MATTFEFRVSCPEECSTAAERCLSDGHALIRRLEVELSEFIPSSPVSVLNRAPAGRRVHMSASAIELLELADRLRRQTRGAFDASAKSPGPAPQTSRFAWDSRTLEAWRVDVQAHLGFGAIGKGYALDRVRLILESAGFHDYLLSAGGSSLVISGFAGPGDPWTWAWSWKKDSDGSSLGVPFRHHTGEAVAIGVSGTHEKGAHLLDPRAHVPDHRAPAHFQSSLVSHHSAAQADALSTALFVSGWESSRQWLNQLDAAPATAAVDALDIPRWNGIFQRLWGSPVQALALGLVMGISSLLLGSAPCRADEAVDLGSLGLDSFTPYLVERNVAWIVLPILAFAMVLLHLQKLKRRRNRQPVALQPIPPLLTVQNNSTSETKDQQ